MRIRAVEGGLIEMVTGSFPVTTGICLIEWTTENGRGVCPRVICPPRALYSQARKHRRGELFEWSGMPLGACCKPSYENHDDARMRAEM